MELEFLDDNISKILQKTKKRIIKYDGKFPGPKSYRGIYEYDNNNNDWIEGFFVGQIWLCYELSNDDFFKWHAIEYTKKMMERIDNDIVLDHHDLGFLFNLSLNAAYKITGEEVYKEYLIITADKLCSRFRELGEFIQCWGKIGDPKEYRIIVDSLMNLPLLYNVFNITNDKKYQVVADKHFKKVKENLIRSDYSAYHTFYFDPETGNPMYGKRAQGNRDESAWARGQSWAIYGTVLNQSYTDKDLTVLFDGALNYYMDRLPENGIAYWDFDFNDAYPSVRDTSSNAIVLCALFERKRQLNTNVYDNQIVKMFNDLQDYGFDSNPKTDIILDHAVYNVARNNGIDEGMAWGDYFYLEAIVRFKNENWLKYW